MKQNADIVGRLRRGWLNCLWLSAALVACALAAQPAAAQPSPAERETARSLMDEADGLRAAGDPGRALERYKAADAIMGVPTTGLEVARTQAQLRQWVEASATAITVENLPVQRGEPRIFAEARKAAAALAAELGPRIPSVVIAVEPVGVRYGVNIDGIQLPEAAHALPFKLNPGDHVVVVQAPGYLSSSNPVALAEAEQAQLKVVLSSSGSPAPSPSSASVALAPSRAAATTSPTPAVLTPPATAAPDTADAAGRTRGYVGVIAGGVVLGVGAVTGVMAAVQTSEIKERCSGSQCPPDTQSDIDAADTLSNVANVTIPLGLLGIGYGLFELITHAHGGDAQADRAARALEIGLSPAGASVSVRGAL
jgi:hypothetical protein